MPLSVEELEAAVQKVLSAEDSQQSVLCLSPVLETLRDQQNLAASFLPGLTTAGTSRDYLRVTSSFESLVRKGSSRWSSVLADQLRAAAAEVMPAMPRRPFARSDFSDSEANLKWEAFAQGPVPVFPDEGDLHEASDKVSSPATGSTEEPKDSVDVDMEEIDEELSSPCIAWLSALLSALLPLLTNALPRDQNEVCIIPHPHKMEQQEAGEDTLYMHGTTGRRPVFNTKKICDNCGTRITDRHYYHCSENCDIDFCQDCHTRTAELLEAFMAEVDEDNGEHLSKRLFWVIDITERIGWHVLHSSVADRHRLANELAFEWPTALFEKLSQAAIDVVNARVVHVQDVKDIQSDERFWYAVGWLQFLYKANELPCKTRRLEEQSSRGPKVDYDRFILEGINKCEPLSEFQRWRKHPSAKVPNVLDILHFQLSDDFCSFLTHSNLVPLNFRRVCLLCDVWEHMQNGRIVPLHLEVPREPKSLVQAVVERFGSCPSQADLRQPLRICFQGEEAGGPGVTREFFQVAMRSFLDGEFEGEKLFSYDEQYWFNEEALNCGQCFQAYGILLGQAVLNNTHVPNIFPRALYDRLLEELESPCARKLRLEDIGAVCPVTAKSLRQILEYSGEDIAEVFGDLGWPRGRQLPADLHISQANKADFVQAYIDWFFHDRIAAQLNPLCEGFKSILGGSFLLRTIVDAVQLEKIVCGGAEKVDVDAIRSGAEIEGWTPEEESDYLPWFWEALASFSAAEMAQFVVFVTASDRVPLRGWQALGLIVQKNGVGDDRLPSAYTCFSQLLLPRFSSKEKLRSGLLTAIANSEGFGLR
ncbi:unnamed protein product [Effrenium voratum]|nr:unnamed protein product [Effrenium voratum]